MGVKVDLEKMWMVAAVGYFKLSQTFRGGIEETHK
jgi:hypothetical protein